MKYSVQHLVDHARGRGQKLGKYGDHNRRRDKSGNVADRLDKALDLQVSQFIQQNGKNNGDREIHCKVHNADDERIAKSLPELLLSQKLPEIAQRRLSPADAVGSCQGLKTAESQYVAQHRSVFKEHEPAKRQRHHRVKLPVPSEILPEGRTVILRFL